MKCDLTVRWCKLLNDVIAYVIIFLVAVIVGFLIGWCISRHE